MTSFFDRVSRMLRPSSVYFTNEPVIIPDPLREGRRAVLAEDSAAALSAAEIVMRVAREAHLPARLAAGLLLHADALAVTNHADAPAAYEAALSAARADDEQALVLLARAAYRQAHGDWEGSRADAETAADRSRGSAPLLEAAAEMRQAAVYLHDDNASYAARLLQGSLPAFALANGSIVRTGNPAPTPTNDFSPRWLAEATGLMGQALIGSGRAADGRALLERALLLSETAGDRAQERRWATALGDRAYDEGYCAEARRFFERALGLVRPDAPAEEAAALRVRLSRVALCLRDNDDAITHAARAFEDTHTPDERRAAQGALGLALRAANRHEEAAAHLQAAIAAPTPAADRETFAWRRALAAAHAESGDVDAAVASYHEAATAAARANLQFDQAQAHRDLGTVYRRRGQIQQAITEWISALALYDKASAPAQSARLRCDLAEARRALGQNARAIKDYEAALIHLNSIPSDDLETRGIVLSNAANAYADHGDVDSADAFFAESIQLAEKTGDRAAESIRSGNYGWFLLTIGRPRRAISTLTRALSISGESGLMPHAAIQTDNLGLAYDSLAELPAALDHHVRARAMLSDAPDPYWAATFRLNESGTRLALNEIDAAADGVTAALAAGRALAHLELTCRALIGAARVALAQHQPTRADAPLTEAAAIARQLDNRRLLAEVLAARSEQQAASDQPIDAAASWGEAARLYNLLHMPQGKLFPAWLKTK